jgi:hypothetical protein
MKREGILEASGGYAVPKSLLLSSSVRLQVWEATQQSTLCSVESGQRVVVLGGEVDVEISGTESLGGGNSALEILSASRRPFLTTSQNSLSFSYNSHSKVYMR